MSDVCNHFDGSVGMKGVICYVKSSLKLLSNTRYKKIAINETKRGFFFTK